MLNPSEPARSMLELQGVERWAETCVPAFV